MRPDYKEKPDRYEVATEVLSSAIRVLQAAGFYESEILQLFEQVSKKRERFPVWLERLPEENSDGKAW
jgi:DNA-binding transcriptional regulator YhcF (GntR family)